jgi:3D-(3,5/4)-trihydroxycyclohexane-1,2-dione acylhydrolase (decyclizing)
VLCVGTRLSDFTTASHALFQARGVRFVGLNVCAADAGKLTAEPVVGDARAALEALHAALAGWHAPPEHVEEARRAVADWDARLRRGLEPRRGERMTQGQVLRELNARIEPGDWVVAAAGSPPGDLLKTWRVEEGTAAHIEFAFSCMGHELPAGLGIRLAQPDAGEVFVVIGDGTYLLGMSELLTAAQEGLRVCVVLFVNGGFQSIHALQDGAGGGPSFGNEFRRRDGADGAPSGALVEVDYAANARSLGATAFEAEDLGDVAAALERVRALPGPVVIVCRVEPRRLLPASGAFWDLGLPQVSSHPGVCAAAARHAEAAAAQRPYLGGAA